MEALVVLAALKGAAEWSPIHVQYLVVSTRSAFFDVTAVKEIWDPYSGVVTPIMYLELPRLAISRSLR